MANKSVIDVDINDKQFKEFYELFKRYSAELGEMPEAWRQVDEATKASTESVTASASVLIESMGSAATHAKNLGEYLRESIEAQKQLGTAAKPGESSLSKMAKDAKSISSSIFGLGKYLFKIGAIGGGILTGASLFGLDKLANSAVANQRDARGLGLTTGQYRAFDTDFGRYLNPEILSSVANAKNSYTGRMWLARATGMDPSSLEAMGSGDIAGNLAIKAHQWWANTPAAQRTDTNLQSTGFAQSGLTMEDMRRLGATPMDQLRRAQSQYGADSGALNVGDRSTESLYSFSRQLTLAGQKLETVFTNKLSQLGPALGALITDLEKDAEYLIDHIFTESNMKGVEEGIRSFASYLGGDDFKNDMKDFIDGIKVMGDAVRKFVGTLAEFTSDKPPGDDASPLAKAWWDAKQAKAANDDFFKSTLGDSASSGYLNSENGTGIASKDSLAARAMKWYAGVTGHDTSEAAVMGAKGPKIPMDQAKLLFSKLEMAKGLQPNLLSAIAQNESGFNPSAVSSKGAVGLMQLMPQVSRNLGVTNPLDWIQNSMGGAELMGQLKTRYGGDLKKQLAAWNWNPSDLDADIKKNGADWDKHLPKETEDFIRRVAGTLAKNAGAKNDVNITITNKSGTNVAMSVNAGSK